MGPGLMTPPDKEFWCLRFGLVFGQVQLALRGRLTFSEGNAGQGRGGQAPASLDDCLQPQALAMTAANTQALLVSLASWSRQQAT
jgi:hypothetical protein